MSAVHGRLGALRRWRSVSKTLLSQHSHTLTCYLRSESSSRSGNSARGSGSTGVSAAALGGAVAGVAVGLLAIAAAIVFLGRRRGWFVSERYIAEYVTRHQPVQQHQPEMFKASDGYGGYHGYQNVAQLPADDIHQAP